MSLSSQMSSESRAFSVALYSFQFVVRYFGFAGALMPSVYPRAGLVAVRADLCNKAMIHDRFLAAMAKERGEFDWTAAALNVSEDAGLR